MFRFEWRQNYDWHSFFLLFSFSAETGIILNLATNLESGRYTVVLRVADNHGMEQDSTVQATVCDCTGKDVECQDRAAAAAAEIPLILGILGGILLLLSKSMFYVFQISKVTD